MAEILDKQPDIRNTFRQEKPNGFSHVEELGSVVVDRLLPTEGSQIKQALSEMKSSFKRDSTDQPLGNVQKNINEAIDGKDPGQVTETTISLTRPKSTQTLGSPTEWAKNSDNMHSRNMRYPLKDSLPPQEPLSKCHQQPEAKFVTVTSIADNEGVNKISTNIKHQIKNSETVSKGFQNSAAVDLEANAVQENIKTAQEETHWNSLDLKLLAIGLGGISNLGSTA